MEPNTKNNKKKFKTPLVIFFVISGIIGIFVGQHIRANNLKKKVYAIIKDTTSLKEKKPLLSSTMFSGKVAYAYQLASEIPEVIDNQFCYCYCRKKHGHKNLLTCFTSNHGAKCEICMNEVIMANDLLKKGWGLEKITEKIDEVFSKIAKQHKSLGHF